MHSNDFAQKARISNSMRKDANYKAYIFLKRTDPLVNMSVQPSKLNGFNPMTDNEFLADSRKTFSPNRKMFEAKLSKRVDKNRKVKSEKKDVNNENQENKNIEVVVQNRPKPKYSLYKKNDE